ncbi:MAG: LemA family protein [Candidatus Lernaella stagnicola]|nr:LemA family protein [Candidatus Lernaella stagnicola]
MIFLSAVFIVFAVIVVLLISAGIYAVVIYNGLVRLRNNIDRNWSNIDVLLKQRTDEIPRLVAVCEGYMRHERNTLEAVTQARASAIRPGGGATAGQQEITAQNNISHALKSLFAVVENYPDLKADQAFRQLQNRITQLEDQIADRREFFNESVNLYNIAIEQFPDAIIARLAGCRPRVLWEIAAEDRAVPSASIKQ